jgi:dTDP-D-glucose 4,6-dehydratase
VPYLRLDSSLAARALGWRPVLDLETTLQWTVDWWRAELAGGDLQALTDGQIGAYRERVADRSSNRRAGSLAAVDPDRRR